MPAVAKEYKDFLFQSLGDGYRYEHSFKVATYAKNLVQSFPQINPTDIEIAALLHDVAKETNFNKAPLYIPESHLYILNFPPVVHAYMGAFMVSKELNITNPDIIDAIMYHTTGKENISLFSLIIYICDFVASLSDDDSSLKQDLLDNASYNIYDTAFQICKETLEELINKQQKIHPDTIAMFNWLLPTVNLD